MGGGVGLGVARGGKEMEERERGAAGVAVGSAG
jgi:hypothetical protein